jgi:hypothetical protein
MNVEEREHDKYYDIDRIISISTTARTLSWFFLLFAILLFIPFIYSMFTAVSFQLQLFISIIFDAIVQISLSLVLLFFWVFLRATSESLYLLLEIEEGLNPNSSEG